MSFQYMFFDCVLTLFTQVINLCFFSCASRIAIREPAVCFASLKQTNLQDKSEAALKRTNLGVYITRVPPREGGVFFGRFAPQED
jgi:hypothetical protein